MRCMKVKVDVISGQNHTFKNHFLEPLQIFDNTRITRVYTKRYFAALCVN